MDYKDELTWPLIDPSKNDRENNACSFVPTTTIPFPSTFFSASNSNGTYVPPTSILQAEGGQNEEVELFQMRSPQYNNDQSYQLQNNVTSPHQQFQNMSPEEVDKYTYPSPQHSSQYYNNSPQQKPNQNINMSPQQTQYTMSPGQQAQQHNMSPQQQTQHSIAPQQLVQQQNISQNFHISPHHLTTYSMSQQGKMLTQQQTQQPNMSAQQQQHRILQKSSDDFSYNRFNNFPVGLDYQRFPDKLYKIQKRIRGKSEQRVEDGVVEFILDFFEPVTLQLVQNINIQLKRTREVANTPKYIGPIVLKTSSEKVLEGTNKYLIKVDLDSVYEIEGKKVYQLQKTATEDLNLFHLIIHIKLSDGRSTTIATKDFLLIGKKTQNPVPPVPSIPYPRNDSFSSGGGAATPSPICSEVFDEDVLYLSSLVAEHIKTKSLKVGDFHWGETIQTHKGDIAYHFPVEDDDNFSEGEVIGLVHDKSKNKVIIKKLTNDNADSVDLKGVITRSQYFEAKVPLNYERTETICMMGIVPVKCHGTIMAHDPIYASNYESGIAVSGYNSFSKHDKKDSALIGYAFTSFYASHENEIGFVKAGVSVLNSASHVLLNKNIRKMEAEWEEKIRILSKKNRRFKKCLGWSSITLFVLLMLIAIYLWQVFTPGTAYRYYSCRKGSIPDETVTFYYDPGNIQQIRVNGIKFKFEKLMEVTDYKHYKEMKVEGSQYYLNIDVCAYGGTRNTRDISTGQKMVGGPDIFAVDSNCKHAYYYNEWKQKWEYIISRERHTNGKEYEKNVTLSCHPSRK